MHRLEWDSSLDTGDERIDAEHRRLFETFSDLNEAAEAGSEGAVGDTLEELTAYVATHFAHEERRMQESGFPEADLVHHVQEHRALTESVRTRVLEYRTDALTIADLVAFLRGWLQHHVREVDGVLIAHLSERRPEPQV